MDNTLGLEEEGDVIDGGNIMDADDLFGRNVTEHGNLCLGSWLQWLLNDYSASDLKEPMRAAQVSPVGRNSPGQAEDRDREGHEPLSVSALSSALRACRAQGIRELERSFHNPHGIGIDALLR